MDDPNQKAPYYTSPVVLDKDAAMLKIRAY
jgi:hypothetical protein